MNKTIPKIVSQLVRKYGTSNPEQLARCLNVTVIRRPLEDAVAGFYKLIKRRKYIFLNSDIDDEIQVRVVLAHELGHAVLHPKENCAFIKSHTLLLTSKIELQANTFAAYLLIDDDTLREYAECTTDQFCQCTGLTKELIELRIK